MCKKIFKYYREKPLQCIILIAFLIRLFSVLFSKGFGMHDDHFLIIESSKSWEQGGDYDYWLPWSQSGEPHPSGHSFFYPILMFCFFKILSFLGINDLNSEMYIVRLIHALWSLLVIYFGYKITEKYTNRKTANVTGWVLTIYWFMPWISVRNLVEVVCIPLLLWGTWIYVKNDKPSWSQVLFSGALMGLAFSVRYQTVFFIGGFGLALLILKKWKDIVIFGLSCLASMTIIQSIPDLILWHRPFAELFEYINYNLNNATSYFNAPWYNYILVILGLLIPPISIFLFGGFIYKWKKWILFLPSFAFLIFHSIFPNKQERFIFTIIPFIIIVGIIGIYDYWQKHTDKLKLKKWFKYSLYFCLVLNIIALVPVTVHYSKKARVESMIYLSHYPETQNIIIENLNNDHIRLPAKTYSNNCFLNYVEIDKKNTWENEIDSIGDKPIAFILFEGEENLQERVAESRKYIPNLVYETTCKESFIDALVQIINPLNSNYPIIIYRNNDVIAKRK